MGIGGSMVAQAVRVLILSGISFFVALIATPFLSRILEKYHFKKQIRDSDVTPVFSGLHQKKAGTPTGGGIIIWGTVIALALFFWGASLIFDGFWKYLNFVNRAETYLPLAFLFISALLGLIDDWTGVLKIGGANGGGLKIRHKLLLYSIIAIVGAWWFFFKLEVTTINLPFMNPSFDIGFWYIPIFMFVIIASAFSANETDGLDGLLGGVALFSFVALATVAFATEHYHLAAFCGVVIGSLLAFLWFNIYPAKFFMGDTGSMSLGITIGVMAMLTNTVLFLPFFAFILVLESLSVILQIASKKIRGKKLFLSAPIHHHFEGLGWPESQITMRFWIISAMMSTLGLILFFLSRFL